MRAPRIARRVLRLLVSPADRDFVLADLDERFQAVVDEKGLSAGRRWYRLQLLRSGPSLIADRLTGMLEFAPGSGLRELARTARALVRSPLYTIGFVGTLAIGLASAVTVSTVAWHLWLSPLPFPDPGRVVRIYELGLDRPAGRARTRVSPPLLEDIRAAKLSTLSGVTGISENTLEWSPIEMEGATRRLSTLEVSPEFFSILGIPAHQGRIFVDSPDEVVLTRSFWKDIGSDPDMIGRPIILGGETHRVVGVVDLPVGYHNRVDVVVPLRFEASDLSEGMRGARYLEVIARVAPSATVGQASQSVDRFVSGLGARYAMHEGTGGVVVSLKDDLTAPFRGVLAILLAAGIAFFLLAAVNLSGLVAARRVASLPDLSVRRALGASRARLAVGAVLEASLLGAWGGTLGLVATLWTLPGLVRLLPPDLPRIDAVGMSPSLGIGLLGMGVLGGGVVGLLGHLLTPAESILLARRGATERLSVRRALVVTQVAITTILAAAGGGVLANALHLRSIDLGFEPEGVMAAYLAPNAERYPDQDALRGFWTGVVSGLHARGFDAAVGRNSPLAGSTMRFGFRTDGSAEEDWAQYHAVSRDFFSILGIGFVEGRSFEDSESAPVVIVSRALVDKHFPGVSPLGRDIRVVGTNRTVVGVVEPTRHFGPDRAAPLELYVPFGQDPSAFGQIVVRSTPEEAGVIASVVAIVDPTVEPSSPVQYESFVRQWYAPVVAQLVIVGLLAAIGVVLATLGLYTIVAYYVSRRQREIGIRLALGAPADLLFRGVLAQGARMAVGGVAIGSLVWLWARGQAAQWTGIEQIGDPLVLGGVGVAVIGISICAVLLPAMRSTRVDPRVSLTADA